MIASLLQWFSWFFHIKCLPTVNHAFHFLNNHVGGHIFQDGNQAQIVKEWLRGSMKNHFHTWIGNSESRLEIHWKSLGCAGVNFTESWTLALSIQDLDQVWMHTEINIVMLKDDHNIKFILNITGSTMSAHFVLSHFLFVFFPRHIPFRQYKSC